MRIEGSMARTTATAVLIVAALYARRPVRRADDRRGILGQRAVQHQRLGLRSRLVPAVMVMVIDPRNVRGSRRRWQTIQRAAVGAACSAPWATNLRFSVTGRAGDGRGA